MYIKLKCCFFKGNDYSILEKYGFSTLNNGKTYYRFKTLSGFSYINLYTDTNRFTLNGPLKKVWYKTVKKYIGDLIRDGLVEIKPMWEYWSFGEVSSKRRLKIEVKLRRKNKNVTN